MLRTHLLIYRELKVQQTWKGKISQKMKILRESMKMNAIETSSWAINMLNLKRSIRI